ncbi:ATP-binding cassette sub-family G member 8 [Patella vulgata]|uniref:ATP-binding cassette sub-family G member 8 n=1 Tax=Patella vulgata TaxID=6465 RepID=UPI0024A851F8|nr:ATP-binding cassette sub-family G member 8 [Patella vulgata]
MASTYVIDPETRHQSININVTNLTYAIDEVGSLPIWKTKLPFYKSKATENEFKSKVILNNVSFTVNSGQMLAIMGCSGSGKTSLLDVLACRNMGGEVRGDIELNGVKHTRGMIETYSAYVRQDDRLLQHLTVKETLMFVAQLKLPTRLSTREVQNKVDGVIAELGLSHVANTRVGGVDIRGISGGERRRVSIGVQLLLDPSILFLDEPTSGLDAFTANHMVQTLANLARNKRTVLLSIHQPRTDIFELFDLVLVLSAGKTVYFGEAKLMVDYFTTLGFPCPELTNPSDFYLDLATIDVTSVETEQTTSEILKNLVIAFELDKTTKSELESLEHSHQTQVATLAGSMDNNSGYPGFFRQFQVLFRRHFRNIVIDYWFLIVQIIQSLTMSTILGSVFWNLSKDQLGMRDRFGLFFMMCVMYPYTVTLDVIGQSHRERHHLYFELQDKLYGHFAYNMAKK